MKKLHQLREHLLKADLGFEPKKLLTFATDGSLSYGAGVGLGSFMLKYTAEIIIVDYNGNPVQLMSSVVQWLRQFVPDHAVQDAAKFSVEVIDRHRSDVLLKVALSEVVKVDQATGETTEQPEPDLAAILAGLVDASAADRVAAGEVSNDE